MPHRHLLLVLALLGCLPACSSDDGSSGGETAAGALTSGRVCASGETVKGIDVSHHQGTIDWGQVKGDGVEFAFIRVSDGHTKDKQFANNWKGAKDAGVIRGVYQFFRPNQDANDQAQLLLSRMGKLEAGDLPPVIDVEDTDGALDGVSNGDLQQSIQTWLSAVEQGTGRKPIVYASPGISSKLGSSFKGYPLWVANYGVQCPHMPSGWSAWNFWQTAGKGQTGGINGQVDQDVFNGSLSDLQSFVASNSGGQDSPDNSGTNGADGQNGASDDPNDPNSQDPNSQDQGDNPDGTINVSAFDTTTWSGIYGAYFASGTIGNCGGCHNRMRAPDTAYSYLAGQGYISGTSSALVASSSILSWFGGTMPPNGPTSNDKAASDIRAWVQAGAKYK